MRYARQRDTYSCGPTAVLNALKWAGQKVTYRENIEDFRKVCKTTRAHGTRNHDLNYALGKLGGPYFHTEWAKTPTLKCIDDAIRWWHQVILGFCWDSNDVFGHYVTLDDITPCGSRFRSINLYKVKFDNGWANVPKTVWWISRDQLKHMMRYRSRLDAWILRRKDDE